MDALDRRAASLGHSHLGRPRRAAPTPWSGWCAQQQTLTSSDVFPPVPPLGATHASKTAQRANLPASGSKTEQSRRMSTPLPATPCNVRSASLEPRCSGSSRMAAVAAIPHQRLSTATPCRVPLAHVPPRHALGIGWGSSASGTINYHQPLRHSHHPRRLHHRLNRAHFGRPQSPVSHHQWELQLLCHHHWSRRRPHHHQHTRAQSMAPPVRLVLCAIGFALPSAAPRAVLVTSADMIVVG